ncbi:MAG: glycoside hydrolase family 16 protein [Bacteroidota bacterium]
MKKTENSLTRILIFMFCITFFLACSIESPIAIKSSKTEKTTSGAKLMATNAGVCDFNLDETTLTTTGWTKIFDENFANLSQWNTWTGGAFNNELQLYQGSNLQLSGGDILINAVKETKTGPTTPFDATSKTFNYTSGRIESKLLFSAASTSPKVRMTARIKLPTGYGMWPAFWSYGDPWPTQGEIDILEARGQEPFNYSTNYFYGRTKNRNLVQNASAVITSSVSLQDCWHVYEMIWTKTSLTFLLDGQIVDTKTGGYVSNLFGKKEKLVLNLAVGGNFFSNLNPALIQTGTMQVDWVKVFKSN